MQLRPKTRSLALSALIALFVATPTVAQQQGDAEGDGLPTIETKTEGMQKVDGFIPLYFDASDGKVWLEIARWDEEILHYTSLPAGMGHNDLGLNRGDLGSRAVVV
jgi:hypothetical protein